MPKQDQRRSSVVSSLFVACVVGITGCSGGGGGGGGPSPAPAPTPVPPPPPPAAPTVALLPTTFDFGKVTPNNTSAPLQVTISNTGTVPLVVIGISLAAPSSGPYALAVGGGAKPCGSATPTIAASDSCTGQIVFSPTTAGTFNSSLQVLSNASNSPTASVPITGTSEAITALNVRINQLDNACAPSTATAYVSVTDQGGFTVLGLLQANFAITQGSGPALAPTTVSYVDAVNKPIAIAAVMDNSGSLTKQPVAFADMKTGFSNLIAAMKPTDSAEILKFATEYEVTQAFTSDKTALQTAINAPFNKGELTLLYDTVFKATDDTALQTSFRRAVIVATDGIDEGPTVGVPLSTHTLQQVIDNAVTKKVAIFTIGIGTSINGTALNQMATQTGGLFYQANASQNLATIYQQLSTILFQKQYVLTFAATTPAASTGNVMIGATTPPPAVSGNATKSVTCP